MKSHSILIKTCLSLALAAVGLALTSPPVSAQVLMGSCNGTYSQNFNGIYIYKAGYNSWTNNVSLLGWFASASNTAATVVGDASGATNIFSAAGVPNTGAFYCFTNTGMTDLAIGSILSGTPVNIAYGVSFTNDTGHALSNFVVSYTGEQWRNGGNTSPQPLAFFYKVDGVAITNADATNTLSTGWTPVTSLNFVSPIATATAAALDGNAAANRTALSASISGLVVLAGQGIFLRWLDINDAGNDHGLAIDDLTVTFETNNAAGATGPAIVTQPASKTVAEGEQAGFTVTASGTQPLSYYWYSIIGSATNFLSEGVSMSLSYVNTNQSGNGFFVVVSNYINMATSSVAVLTVTQHLAPTSVTIGYLRGLRDATTFAVTDTTNLYTIEGIVTTPDLLASPLESYFVQDNTGGMDVFCRDGGFPMPSVGDRVRISGPLMNYFGLLEMNITNGNPTHHMEIISSGNALPAPQLLDFSSITPATMESSVEGSLMVISNVFIGVTNDGRYVLSGATINLTNLTGQVFRLVNPAAAIDPQGNVLPLFAKSITGAISQYTTATVPTNGYFMEFVAWSDLVAGDPPVIVVLPVLDVQFSTPNLTLSWTDATYSLQTAPEVTGTYVTLTGVTSPFTTNITSNARLFFRLIK
jgi:hypothetical protein